jgi:hypothetical protein
VFLSACAAVLVGFVRPQRVTGANLSEDAPTQFVPMSDSLQSSNVVANLDPRVDVASDVSFVTPEEEGGSPLSSARKPSPEMAASMPSDGAPQAAPTAQGGIPEAADASSQDADAAGQPHPAAGPQADGVMAGENKPAPSAGHQDNDGADGKRDAKDVDQR